MIYYEQRGKRITGAKYRKLKETKGTFESSPKVEPGTGKIVIRLINQYGLTDAVKVNISTEAERIKQCGQY